MDREEGRKKCMRAVIYVLGFVFLALGIILNTKSDFGVTAIISVPYALHLVTGYNYGNMCLAVYLVYAAVEYIVKGRNFKAFDLLQLPVSLAITRLFNLFTALLPDPAAIAPRIVCMLLGIVCTGLGASLMLHARFVPTPADGMVQALSDRTGRSAGFCKNCFDLTSVAASCIFGLICRGKILGVGIGTVLAMIFVGRVMALYGRFIAPHVLVLTGTVFDRGGAIGEDNEK